MINIRYAQIRECDISNGENVGVALFVQGCPSPHCKNCFNPETWNFNGGKEWTEEIENKFFELTSRPYIKRISVLGGEPLADGNLDGILHLVNKIRFLSQNKSIWLYTGYTWEEIWDCPINGMTESGLRNYKRQQIVKQTDIVVDGRYIDSQRDITLKWRGSKNQRVIDVKKSLQQNKIFLYSD